MQSHIFLGFSSFRLLSQGTDGMNADFDYEPAHGAKDAGTATETESQHERRVFKVLVILSNLISLDFVNFWHFICLDNSSCILSSCFAKTVNQNQEKTPKYNIITL